MSRGFTLGKLSELAGADLKGDPSFEIFGVNTLEEAAPTDLSFLASPRYNEAMKRSKAGAICIAKDAEKPEGKHYLISDSPSRTFQQIVEALFTLTPSVFQGIHPTAIIHESATIGKEVTIGPYAVIDQNVQIGDGTTLSAHTFVGAGSSIGKECFLHPQVVIRERCILKDRVQVQPGAIIGSCGFGYLLNQQGKHQKLEQLGIVILEEDVEIGANTTIDRSRFKATIVKAGSKIDNLCQIAHNVEIGEHNIIAAQTGIAGSSKTGKYVVLGGQVGVVGHIELEDQVMVASRGGISKSLKKGKYRGTPVLPLEQYQRQEVYLRKIETYVKKIKELEKTVEALSS